MLFELQPPYCSTIHDKEKLNVLTFKKLLRSKLLTLCLEKRLKQLIYELIYHCCSSSEDVVKSVSKWLFLGNLKVGVKGVM